MNRVKYESVTTGTLDLTLTVVTGFQDVSASVNPYPVTGAVTYMILDADTVNWEKGYGVITGTTLARADANVFESTNANNRISLSSGTHTVLINRGFYEGFIIVSAYEPSAPLTFLTASSSITFAAVGVHPVNSQPIDGVSYAPGKASGSVATIVGDPESELPYCRGYRLTLTGSCDTVSAGNHWGLGIDPNNFSVPPLVANYAPLIGTDTVVSVTTPMIENRNPWGGANGAYLPFGTFVYNAYNTSGSNITVNPMLFIEWYL